jgi:hypothetical protein
MLFETFYLDENGDRCPGPKLEAINLEHALEVAVSLSKLEAIVGSSIHLQVNPTPKQETVWVVFIRLGDGEKRRFGVRCFNSIQAIASVMHLCNDLSLDVRRIKAVPKAELKKKAS